MLYRHLGSALLKTSGDGHIILKFKCLKKFCLPTMIVISGVAICKKTKRSMTIICCEDIFFFTLKRITTFKIIQVVARACPKRWTSRTFENMMVLRIK